MVRQCVWCLLLCCGAQWQRHGHSWSWQGKTVTLLRHSDSSTVHSVIIVSWFMSTRSLRRRVLLYCLQCVAGFDTSVTILPVCRCWKCLSCDCLYNVYACQHRRPNSTEVWHTWAWLPVTVALRTDLVMGKYSTLRVVFFFEAHSLRRVPEWIYSKCYRLLHVHTSHNKSRTRVTCNSNRIWQTHQSCAMSNWVNIQQYCQYSYDNGKKLGTFTWLQYAHTLHSLWCC